MKYRGSFNTQTEQWSKGNNGKEKYNEQSKIVPFVISSWWQVLFESKRIEHYGSLATVYRSGSLDKSFYLLYK